MQKVVYLGTKDGIAAAGEALEGVAELVPVESDPGLVATALADAAGLLDASMKVQITDELVRACPSLEIVSCASTGSDHVARGELTARGIPVRTLREDRELLLTITPAAELSWTLLLACARRLPGALQHVKEGKWQRELFPGVLLHGKCIGIVGCGRLGEWMSRYAHAFGMSILGHDPHLDSFPEHVEPVDLMTLMSRADFITVHVHLSDETRGLVSRECLQAVKPGAILVNTSRGALVNEAALLEALENGKLAAAGVDVLDGEPETANHPLVAYAREHDNLLITPHCGGLAPGAVARVCRRAAEKIAEHLRGETS